MDKLYDRLGPDVRALILRKLPDSKLVWFKNVPECVFTDRPARDPQLVRHYDTHTVVLPISRAAWGGTAWVYE